MPPYQPLHDRPDYFASLKPSHPRSPHYASPDLDPDEPYPWTRQGLAMCSEQDEYEKGEGVEQLDDAREEYQDEENGNGDDLEELEQEPQAGPSRKRPRTEDERPANGSPNHAALSRRVVDTPIIPSVFGISPRNEFTKTVGEFIMAHCRGQDNVEVGSRDQHDRER
jgi:polynucleotide 5'-triphosphatase